MATTSRLGEAISPERDPSSLKTHKNLAWTRNCAQHEHTSLLSRLGEPLSPKRECHSLNNNTARLDELQDL
ncbi:hypothetical protein DEO72_LG5g549 [Vigna unguiculata]|uniref:Uncharacterized protein n=1 Tax=Vigna unguiculata TaxID=3917 RepID=A0A4D6LV11_VIGUN|nr:hypothetical protein DEO72_LG5g549 [Vigna unguiculata]